MSHKHKGQLTVCVEWAKHLRPYMRQHFWRRERLAERELIRTKLQEIKAESNLPK